MVVSVLIVDDHEPFRRAACTVVEATEGFRVAGTAANGENSMEVAGRLRPDLVLMDVHLPGIDGLEATRRLRARFPATVVVLVSTYDEAEMDLPTDLAGAVGYLAKWALAPDRLVAMWESSLAG
jgi:DNA-binding NarL/FixJ family response regulator